MKEILHKVKPFIKVMLIMLVVVIIAVLAFIYNMNEEQQQSQEPLVSIIPEVEEEKTEPVVEEVNYLYVDVKGAVKKPGVYKLEEGSRVIDAINKSGGLNKNADTSVINLSKKLEDGNVIIIYTSDYIEQRKKEEIVIEYIEKDCVCPDNTNDSYIDEEDIVIEKPENNDNDANKIINLNTATKEELLTLPGIGESKADDILNYIKDKGKFKSVEEIKDVKGIGDALFEKIKDRITV